MPVTGEWNVRITESKGQSTINVNIVNVRYDRDDPVSRRVREIIASSYQAIGRFEKFGCQICQIAGYNINYVKAGLRNIIRHHIINGQQQVNDAAEHRLLYCMKPCSAVRHAKKGKLIGGRTDS